MSNQVTPIEFDAPMPDQRAAALARLNDLYARAYHQGDIAACLAIQCEIDALLGLTEKGA